jgi:DNA-binding PadR family transcriptional regulator
MALARGRRTGHSISIMDTSTSERSPARDPRELVPLLPAVFHIMLALAEGGLHGYGIMLEVERLTGGQIRLGPGTLYRSIQRMLVDGLIEEAPASRAARSSSSAAADDERRRYYRLTKLGHAAARAEAERLAALVAVAEERGLLRRAAARRRAAGPRDA